MRDVEPFRSQFLFCKRGTEFPTCLPKFQVTSLGSAELYHATNLPVLPIDLDCNRSLVIVGWCFNEQGELLQRENIRHDLNKEQVFSECVLRYWGRYLCAFVDESSGDIDVTPDCAGTLSAFYQSDGDFVVSTPALAAKLRLTEPSDDELQTAESRCREETGYWFVAGLSGFTGLRLLLPNHTWRIGAHRPIRVWPSSETFVGRRLENDPTANLYDLDTGIRAMASAVQSAAKTGKILLPLTAGRDSRTLLALVASERLEDRTLCFTDGDTSADDALYAKTLARATNCEWTNGNGDLHGCCLPGFGGEIVKGYWYAGLDPATKSWRTQVLNAFPFYSVAKHHPVVSNELNYWIDETIELFPASDCRILDLAYLELRWACTMGQVHYRYDQNYGASLAPYAHPQLVQTAFRLRERIRRRMSFWRFVCGRRAPNLLLLPAGTRQFSKRWFAPACGLLLLAWLLPARMRCMIYSAAYLRALKRTITA